MRLHHLSVLVHDVPRCAAFYREVLGLPEVPCPRPGPAWFQVGDALLMLEPCEEEPTVQEFREGRPGPCVLALGIEPSDRAEWEEKLRGAGVAVVYSTDYTLYVRDPEGNRIGLSHYPFRAP